MINISTKYTYEEVREWVENNSECELLSTEYVRMKNKLLFRCRCGKEFTRTFDSFKKGKFRLCGECAIKEKAKTKRNYVNVEGYRTPIDEVISLLNSINCEYIDRYTKEGTRSTIIKFRCEEHGIQEVYWTNLKKRKSCPMCQEYNKQNSRLSKGVEKYLIDNDIEYIKEYKFDDCVDKRKLPFDFYLPKYNTCLEVQGRQHYELAFFGGATEEQAKEKLAYTQYHDKIKKEYCNNNNIDLIEIPYWLDNKNKDYINCLTKINNKQIA